MTYLKDKQKIKKALEIIRDKKPFTASQFGSFYFEGHPILERQSNIGNGATKGVGAWFVAGRLLSGLDKDGYIGGGYFTGWKCEYFLTKKGKEFLDEVQ